MGMVQRALAAGKCKKSQTCCVRCIITTERPLST
jgi:hypothetical protein